MNFYTKLLNFILLIFLLLDKSSLSNEFDEKIKKYLLNNPEIIIQSLSNYEKQKEVEQNEANRRKIKDNKDRIYNSKNSLYEGNSSSSTLMVEFFDYNCSYCKRAHADLKKVLNKKQDVKVIYKNFPILSENSLKLAKYAVAISEINNQKFVNFHNKIMNHKGRIDDKKLNEILSDLDIDVDKINDEVKKTTVDEKIKADIELANILGLRGTPAFIIGEELIFGYINYDEIISRLD